MGTVAEAVAIMAVDPGKVTGVAGGYFNLKRATTTKAVLRRAKQKGVLSVLQIDGEPDEQAHALLSMWERFEALANIEQGIALPAIHVAFESFQLRQRDAELWPVEVKAGFLALSRGRGFRREGRYHEQTPSQAMGYATNARLRDWGVWAVGLEHGRDALRHLSLMVSKALDGELSS